MFSSLSKTKNQIVHVHILSCLTCLHLNSGERFELVIFCRLSHHHSYWSCPIMIKQGCTEPLRGPASTTEQDNQDHLKSCSKSTFNLSSTAVKIAHFISIALEIHKNQKKVNYNKIYHEHDFVNNLSAIKMAN